MQDLHRSKVAIHTAAILVATALMGEARLRAAKTVSERCDSLVSMDGELLTGGRTTQGVVRIGDTVRRPILRDAAFAHECLLHLERVGFGGAPRFLGVDEDGRQILSFLAGFVPADLGDYTDAQLQSAAALLRQFHDATATMPQIRDSGFEVACHNDWSPTNAVFERGEPVGMIDFDTALPGERLWDLGYSAFTWLDLGNDDLPADEQVRRMGIFAEGYGHRDCTASRIAVYAIARQTALAASTRACGKLEVADWASHCAAWTVLNVLERLLPTGYWRQLSDGIPVPASARRKPEAD